MPNKHHNRWGTKLWLLADSPTRYILQLYVYEGAQHDPTRGHDTGYDVVVRLMQMGNVLDKSHHLYLDNLFVRYAVGKFLHDWYHALQPAEVSPEGSQYCETQCW